MPKGIPNAKSVYIVSEQSVRDLIQSVQTFMNSAQTLSLTGGTEHVSPKPVQKRRGRKPKAQNTQQETQPTIQIPKVD